MTSCTSSFVTDYRNFADLHDGGSTCKNPSMAAALGTAKPDDNPSENNDNRRAHFRRNSLSLRDVAHIASSTVRQESSELLHRKAVLEKVFDLNLSEDAEDLSREHSNLYLILHPRNKSPEAKLFRKCMTSFVLLDLMAFILSTEKPLYKPHKLLFQCIEGITASIFLIEYVARMATITENTRYGSLGTIRGRLKWICTCSAVLDLLALLPFFINVATGWRIPSISYTRILRVVRLLKTDSYKRAFGACYRVIYYNREILYVAFLVCFLLVLVSSVLLYFCRPRNVEIQIFESIPAALYTSLLMLTGQDAWIRSTQFMPWYTKVVVGLTGALSVAMFAIPVSLLTWGFESEAIRCARKTSRSLKRSHTYENDNTAPVVSVQNVDSLNSDEEYLKIIAKESSEDSSKAQGVSDESKRKVKELVERYLRDDVNGRKFVALSDFLMASIEYRVEEDMSFVEGFREPLLEASDVGRRVDNLELSVTSLHSKMDSILRTFEIQGREVPSSNVI